MLRIFLFVLLGGDTAKGQADSTLDGALVPVFGGVTAKPHYFPFLLEGALMMAMHSSRVSSTAR